MDPNIGSLKMSPNRVPPVLGVGQYLPFEEGSFHGVHISAALHHAWKELPSCLDEIYRVVQPGGGVIIWEPLDVNPITWLGRQLFKPEDYDTNEKPLDRDKLLEAVSLNFDILNIKYYFLFSYTMPHLIARLPLKSFWRKVAMISFINDKYLLAHHPFLRFFAAYIKITAIRRNKVE